MTEIKDVADFTVNVADQRVTAAGFGTLIFLAPLTNFAERFRLYSNNAGVLADFDATDPVAIAANIAFSQKSEAGQLRDFKVGKQLVDIVDVEVSELTGGGVDTGDSIVVTVTTATQGLTYAVDFLSANAANTYDIVSGDGVIEVAAGLVAAINGGADVVTATDNLDGTFTLTADVPDTKFTIALYTSPIAAPTTVNFEPLMTTDATYQLRASEALYATTGGSADTVTTIAAAFVTEVTAINADFAAYNITAGNTAGVITLTASTSRVDFLVYEFGARVAFDFSTATGRGSLLYNAPSTSETIAETLLAISDVDDDYYGVTQMSALEADQIALAVAIEALVKKHGYVSEDTEILNAALSGDIGSIEKAAGHNRTWGEYHNKGDQFEDVATFADRLPTTPGSSTWKFKDHIGVDPVELTRSQRAAALGKNVNVQSLLGGNKSLEEGVLASGRFIDVQRSMDFMEARIGEAFVARLQAEPKIPYTDPGFAILDSVLREQMQSFVTLGILGPLLDSEEGEFYRIIIPTVAQQTTADRQARTVRGISVEAQLAGAIHKVVGTVNVSV